jgi:hypothetical protein
MNIDELRELLKTDIVTVSFIKKDGSKREMICTTISDYLPEISGNNASMPSDNLVTVWDLEQGGWRSFKFDSITSIETDYFNYVVGS